MVCEMLPQDAIAAMRHLRVVLVIVNLRPVRRDVIQQRHVVMAVQMVVVRRQGMDVEEEVFSVVGILVVVVEAGVAGEEKTISMAWTPASTVVVMGAINFPSPHFTPTTGSECTRIS